MLIAMGVENILPDCLVKRNITCSFVQTTSFVTIKFVMFVLNCIFFLNAAVGNNSESIFRAIFSHNFLGTHNF